LEPFAAVPEQHEAKRLLTAALADGDAHAFLFHGLHSSETLAASRSGHTPTCGWWSRSET